MSTLRYMAAMFGPSIFWVGAYWIYTVIEGVRP